MLKIKKMIPFVRLLVILILTLKCCSVLSVTTEDPRSFNMSEKLSKLYENFSKKKNYA